MTLGGISRLLLVVAYVVATTVAAASPLAACPALDRDHAGHLHGVDDSHHQHHHRSGSHAGECLNCGMGTWLLGTSLPAPSNGAMSLAFYGTPVVYASEQSALADRSIPPRPRTS